MNSQLNVNSGMKRTYKVLVTGVPVSIHRYFALTWARLMLDRVALLHISPRYKTEGRCTPIADELGFICHSSIELGACQETTNVRQISN